MVNSERLQADHALIEDWKRAGTLTTDQILERLRDEEYAFGGDELVAIQANFNNLAINEGGVRYILEPAFTSFIASSIASSFPNQLIPIVEAGPILFTSTTYLADYPFAAKQRGLTYQGFQRALTWNSPDGAERIIRASMLGDGLVVRARTAVDYRRIIFQSLAHTISDSPPDARERQQKVFDSGLSEHLLDFWAPNNDADGDEIYHDVLDILSATQPIPIHAIPVLRDSLRPLATELYAPLPRLRQLGVSRTQLISVVKAILSLQQNDGLDLNPTNTLAGLDYSATSVVNAFTSDETITYPVFEAVISQIMPFLLDPIHTLIETFLCAPAKSDPRTQTAIPSGKALTLPVLAQLTLIFSNTIVFEGLQLVHQHISSSPTTDKSSTLTGFVNTIKGAAEPCVLLVSGKSSVTNEAVTFGAFFPGVGSDTTHDFTSRPDACEGSMLFQLTPTHDIFRTKLSGQKAWELLEGDEATEALWFGKKGHGVALGLTKGLESGVFVHSTDTNAGNVYVGNVRRADWEITFKIEAVEVWVERV